MIYYQLEVLLYIFMVLSDEYIYHKLVVSFYIFMVFHDECIYHKSVVLLCIFMAIYDEYIVCTAFKLRSATDLTKMNKLKL